MRCSSHTIVPHSVSSATLALHPEQRQALRMVHSCVNTVLLCALVVSVCRGTAQLPVRRKHAAQHAADSRSGSHGGTGLVPHRRQQADQPRQPIDAHESSSGSHRRRRPLHPQQLLATLVQQWDRDHYPRAVRAGYALGSALTSANSAIVSGCAQASQTANGLGTKLACRTQHLQHSSAAATHRLSACLQQRWHAVGTAVQNSRRRLQTRPAAAADVHSAAAASDAVEGDSEVEATTEAVRVGGGQTPWQRALRFWTLSSAIYLSYKKMEVQMRLGVGVGKTEAEREATWDALHEINSDRMLAMCLELRAFYLKVC